MKKIGIKLADGSFYPILQDGVAEKKQLNLTTVKDNQTTVQVDLYRSENDSLENAEYFDTLEIKNLKKHPNGEPDINLIISIDENNELHAELHDQETGKDSYTTVSLVSKTLEQLDENSDITLAELDDLNLPDSSIEEESFADAGDIDFDPNSLNVDSLVEETESTIVSDADSAEFADNGEFADSVDFSDSADFGESSNFADNGNFADDDNFSDNAEFNAGLDFSDILDEETKEGHAGSSNTEEIKKKTKVPVLICIICAIICILAVILILIFNCNKKSAQNVPENFANTSVVENQNENASDTNLTKTEEEKYPAQEDKIVVAPAQEITPVEPEKKEQEKKNVTYKIKWGDTLWDLSKSYYNNPWKYPVIAKYNGIKNPDKIISGKTIIIPAE